MKDYIETVRRYDGKSVRRLLAVGIGLTVLPSHRLAAQSFLEQFSYDNLQPTGLRFELGALGASRLRGAMVGAFRFDAGNIAPRVRVLLGLSYFRSNFSQSALADFANKVRALVNDPDSNFTVNVGQIRWSDLTGDLDLQYAFPQSRTLTTFLGAGVGVHLRHASGTAINGTFIQDALDGLFPAANVTVGVEARVTSTLALSAEGRGVISQGLSTASLSVGVLYRFHGWTLGGAAH